MLPRKEKPFNDFSCLLLIVVISPLNELLVIMRMLQFVLEVENWRAIKEYAERKKFFRVFKALKVAENKTLNIICKIELSSKFIYLVFGN